MKNIHVITMLAALMITFAACTEKEKPETEVTTQKVQQIKATYTIDRVPNFVTLNGVEAYRSLVGDLVGKTREGKEIELVLDGVEFRTVATKAIDTVLVSDSLELVMEWIERMNYCGYDVVVRYDETTGTYHCKAQIVPRSTYQHMWQCDTNGSTIRLMFWNDSMLYIDGPDTSNVIRRLFDVVYYSNLVKYRFSRKPHTRLPGEVNTLEFEYLYMNDGTILAEPDGSIIATYCIDTISMSEYCVYRMPSAILPMASPAYRFSVVF